MSVGVKDSDDTSILLTCGAVGILWACSEGAGTGPLFYSYPRPEGGHENNTFSQLSLMKSLLTAVFQSLYREIKRCPFHQSGEAALRGRAQCVPSVLMVLRPDRGCSLGLPPASHRACLSWMAAESLCRSVRHPVSRSDSS